MRIKIVSIPVRDQQKALDFYTNILGFVKKVDAPLGGGNRWLTVVSKYDQDGPELLLEPAPNHFEPSKVYQEALMEAGIPWTQFYVDDAQAEYERLIELDEPRPNPAAEKWAVHNWQFVQGQMAVEAYPNLTSNL